MDTLETRRQIIHMSGVILPFYIMLVGWKVSIFTFASAIIIGALIAEGYKRGVNMPILSKMIDIAERPETIEKNPAKGALLFFIGSFISLLLFRLDIASASIMILALGDSFSTIIGKNCGRTEIFYNPAKSLEGSMAGFFFAFLGAYAFLNFYTINSRALSMALIGALIGMLVESLPPKIDDNITIPLSSGFGMSLVLYFF